ncbi:LysE family translocator [Prevotella communis]|uniref:LysE family translocator n=1 Tax=Prevotella communis TaxID=2913614 RepID=UPI000B838AB9|nr:LysE family transporter [Prevotella communis]UKK55387.1 LysE family translocator [Prevotella communis]UKK60876.1 LysE family translocator [Prevotella communis]UKK63702.1 LysE family translocator [Prevotella communis]UKK68804.1 LysE family translocator [Prevotella communis]UKK71721.1 LysE family translocator [Prevotella communis]
MTFDVNTIPNLLDIVFKGLLIGIIASAPMGPVGVLCVQRTLNKGRWYGFVTGCGAALSDIIYAGITGLGMGMVVELVSNDTNRFYLQIVGSLMLLAFGVFTYRTDPTKNLRKPGQNKGTLTHNGITAFLVTLSNPLIVFLFMALYAQFSFGLQIDKPIELVAGFISIIGGALLWWWGLTWLVDVIRLKFDNNGIRIINRIIGTLVIIGSIIVLLTTLFSLHLYNIF